ncbi:MAG: hypothetical protein RI932_238 [Pseudomonadota bacterium]|jgi:SAM-dependent methyltransferase
MRADENSLNNNDAHPTGLFLDRMQFFYELFPYPNRPFFLRPDPKGSLEAHAGYSQILATQEESSFPGNFDDLQLRDVRHAFAVSKRIALVGCGTDEPLLFRALHPHNPIVAIDLSHRSLLRAEKKLRWHRFKPVTLIHGDAEIALKQEGVFDHMQCFGVLHHQPEPQKLLQAMATALAKDGTLRLMIYSSKGRQLERGLQRRFQSFWQSLNTAIGESNAAPLGTRINLKWVAFKLLLWRMFLPMFGSSVKSKRFRYIGLSRARLADAFLHPSDHPLRLRDTLEWAAQCGLKLVAYKAKSYDLGWLSAQTNPQNSIQTLVDEEERGNISTNIVLVFKKVGNA